MNNSNKLNIFTEALKRAKEGDLFNYDNWLKENGVNPRKINLKYFESYFRANPDKIAGNEEIIQKVAEFIGHFLKEKKGIYHLPIIGIKGSGKTLLLRILERFTNDFEPNLSTSIDIIRDNRYLLQAIDSRQLISSPDRVRIHFIDNCDKVDNIIKILENILKLKKDSVYVTSWTPESWIRYREEINNILPISEEFIIPPLKLKILKYNTGDLTNEFFWFLENILKSILISEKQINEPYLYPDFADVRFVCEKLSEIFYEYTRGIPLIAIKLLLNCIKQVFLLRQKEINEPVIVDVAIGMGLHMVEGRLDEVSVLHLQILLTILLDTKGKGTRPMQLVKEFGLDKSTISYHLNTLKDLELIEDEKIGKSKFYKVKENLIPFVQLKVLNKIYLKK